MRIGLERRERICKRQPSGLASPVPLLYGGTAVPEQAPEGGRLNLRPASILWSRATGSRPPNFAGVQMASDTLKTALITETFFDEEGPARLTQRLKEARAQGAGLAVLPELPLNSWAPAERTPREADAEPPGGAREAAQTRAARDSGVWLLGGIIVRDPHTDRRHNEAILVDSSGQIVHRYRKLHLPQEEGFWEADHYDPGETLPRPVDVDGFSVGIQLCSDMNRPQVCHLLGAMGALAILAPRATPGETWERWRLVLRANAVTSGCYVISVNRPGPEPGVSLGGASLAVGPDGEVLAESVDPLVVVPLEKSRVLRARQEYPGYLAIRSRLYAEGWRRISEDERD
jgi:predicted amidohydrolase